MAEEYLDLTKVSKGEIIAETMFPKKKKELNYQYTGKYVQVTKEGKIKPVQLRKQLSKEEIRRVGIKAGIYKQQLKNKGKQTKKLSTLGLFGRVAGSVVGLKQQGKSVLKRRDKTKILQLKIMLERKRFENEIEKLRIRNTIEKLKRQGKIPGIKPLAPPPIQVRLRPEQIIFADSPETVNDIDSSFNADIGHADGNIFGDEDYFGGENYFDEDYFGTEFNDGDALAHLHIKPKRGLSPLFW